MRNFTSVKGHFVYFIAVLKCQLNTITSFANWH